MDGIGWAALALVITAMPITAIMVLAKVPPPKAPADPHAHQPASLTVPCPLCHADAGQPCVFVGTREPRKVAHMKRIEAAYND